MTKVVNLMKEQYDIAIDRSSKWGNPYSHKKGTMAKYVVATREEAIEKYREYILHSNTIDELYELKGKTLGCWCYPLQCHGDVLVDLVEKFCTGDDWVE